MTNQCLNCNTPLQPEHKFCFNCGQKTHLHRINLGYVAHEVVHFITHADSGIFYLIKMLAFHPGRVAREYIQGKRKLYFGPMKFFLIIVGLFVFITATFNPMGRGSNVAGLRQEVMKIENEEVRNRRLQKLERSEKATNFVAKYSNIIRFIATPLFALLYFLFLRRSGYNYTEFVVASLYFSGFTALVFIVIITPFMLLTSGIAGFAGIILYMLFEIVYWSIGMHYFLPWQKRRKYAYVLFVAFLVTLTWFITSGFLIRLYIETGFNFNV